MIGKFELKKGRSGKFSFNLKSANGKVVLTSQTYKSKAAAKNGIKAVCASCRKKANFEEKKTKVGKPYFVLVAANKQVVGKSQSYASRASMLKGIASVKKNAPKAAIRDLSLKK
ncbi:MAG: YegP family protein [Desulfobacterales bacterium]|nr:YegP family protein [Desulfobacterales bacterium]